MIFGGGVTGGLGTGIVFSLHDQFSATADKISAKFDKLNGLSDVAVQRFNSAQNSMRKGFSAMVVAAGILAPLVFALNTTARLDDQMADVAKTTGMAKTEVLGLKKAMFEMDTRTGIGDLLDIAKIGGQVGIAKDQIFDFTKAVDKVSVALGDEFSGGAEEVSSTLGKLRNIMTDVQSAKIDQDLLKIGNAINVLGAAGFATGPVVADFASRIGGIGIPLGLSTGQVLGLSASLQELNVEAERGGSAIGRALQRMLTNTEAFAKIAGMSQTAFEGILNTDIYGAFMKVIEGSRKYGKNSVELAGILDELKLDGIGTAEVFLKLGSRMDLLQDKTGLATKALQGTDSIMQEFNIKNATLPALFDKASKAMTKLADVVGTAVAPVFVPLIGLFLNFVDVISSIADSPVARVFIQLIAISGVLLGVFGTVVLVVNAMKFASAKAAIAFLELGNAQLAATFANKGLIAGMRQLIVTTYANVRANMAWMFSYDGLMFKMRDIRLAILRKREAMLLNTTATKFSISSMLNYSKSMISGFFSTQTLTKGVSLLSTGFITLNTVLGPVGWAILAIAAMFLVARKSMSMFREVMEGNRQPAHGFTGILQRMGGVLVGVSEIFKTANKNGFEMSSQLHDSLQKMGILEMVVNLGTWAVRLKALWYGIVDGFKDGVNKIWKPIKTGLDQIAKWLDDLGLGFWKNTSSIKEWFKWGKIIGSFIAGTLIGTLLLFATVILLPLIPILALVIAIRGIYLAIKNWGSVVDWFKGKWNDFTNYIGLKFMLFAEDLRNVIEDVKLWFSGIKDWFNSLWINIVDNAKSTWNNFKNWFINLWSNTASWFIDVFKSFLAFGALIVNYILDGIVSKWSTFKMWITSLWGNVLSWFSGSISNFVVFGSSIINHIYEGILFRWSMFKNWFVELWSNITDWFTGIGDTLYNIGASFVDWIWEGIKSKISSLLEWVNNIASMFGEAFSFLFGNDEMNMNVNHSLAGAGNTGNIDMPTNRSNMGISETGKIIAQEKQIERNRESKESTIEKHYHSEKVENIQVVLPDGRVLANLVNEQNQKNDFRRNGRN